MIVYATDFYVSEDPEDAHNQHGQYSNCPGHRPSSGSFG